MRFVFFRSKLRGIRPLANKFAQNSIYLSSQQATRYFGKLPLRVVMRFVFFRSKLRGIRPLAIDCLRRYRRPQRYQASHSQWCYRRTNRHPVFKL
ncbi:hypothetical protein PsalMR5_03880 [Piscirickettsia salmonis]|uniref:hypothetical protein n=1 Tax=Piscirickettsia salmonis TaxID=1238 RepID=UPI0012BAEF41|nr:hypothetical protein [Piscirickettsia salmonis]QGP56397.1 hypothetical protein PsalSR1_03881 [Piscirickettsia salmonis]QGP57739.1 hypothetical protein PsalBI1_00277 [Piscirickettsia salmonis]QGP65960.1 hypothetical protein PsalMR5_03880 [Piscirickettsia salmonis]